MEINPGFLAPCGLYCRVCAIRSCTKEKGYLGCGHQLFRGAKRCNKCEIPVDVD